jgi:hypothetical protein
MSRFEPVSRQAKAPPAELILRDKVVQFAYNSILVERCKAKEVDAIMVYLIPVVFGNGFLHYDNYQ